MGNDKRLLKRNEQGEVRYATPCKGNSVQELYEEEREKDKAIMEKLCNLEDKIENGTLIERPPVKKERKETAENIFNTIINALETKKASIIAYYGVKESVGADIAIRTVKELAKRRGIEIKG